jgi:hypothetical protein
MMRQCTIRHNQTGLNPRYRSFGVYAGHGTGFESVISVRGIHFISICCLAAGCASHAPQPTPEARVAAFEERPASALVFDLPMDRGMMHPELARANRQNAAFLGFDTQTTESYITATDTISTELGDFHTNESITIKSGTRIR